MINIVKIKRRRVRKVKKPVVTPTKPTTNVPNYVPPGFIINSNTPKPAQIRFKG